MLPSAGGVQLTAIELANGRTRSDVGGPGTNDSVITQKSQCLMTKSIRQCSRFTVNLQGQSQSLRTKSMFKDKVNFNPCWIGRTYMSLNGKGWKGHICSAIVTSCTWW